MTNVWCYKSYILEKKNQSISEKDMCKDFKVKRLLKAYEVPLQWNFKKLLPFTFLYSIYNDIQNYQNSY